MCAPFKSKTDAENLSYQIAFEFKNLFVEPLPLTLFKIYTIYFLSLFFINILLNLNISLKMALLETQNVILAPFYSHTLSVVRFCTNVLN